MRSMFVRQTMAGVYPACQCGSCSLFGFFDVDFIFKGAFHSCYREFTFSPCNVNCGLVEFIFDSHSVEFTFGFCDLKFNSFFIRTVWSLSREPTF